MLVGIMLIIGILAVVPAIALVAKTAPGHLVFLVSVREAQILPLKVCAGIVTNQHFSHGEL